MNLCIAKTCIFLSTILSYMCFILFILIAAAWACLLPIGIALHFSNSRAYSESMLMMSIGIAPWAALACFGCVNGCNWFYTQSFETVERAKRQTQYQNPAAFPFMRGELEDSSADPIESVL